MKVYFQRLTLLFYFVAQGSAIGLERLAPLGAVAIGGLIVGTFMTLVFIPLVFVWVVDERSVKEKF